MQGENEQVQCDNVMNYGIIMENLIFLRIGIGIMKEREFASRKEVILIKSIKSIRQELM